jgi:hypothetical protein
MENHYRIRKVTYFDKLEGYVVEYKKYKWTLTGLKISWESYLYFDSKPVRPMIFSNYDFALNELTDRIKDEIKSK